MQAMVMLLVMTQKNSSTHVVDLQVIGNHVGLKLLLGDSCPVIFNWITSISSLDIITLEYFYMPFIDNLEWKCQCEGLSLIHI